jgi:AcrR family transcriptional regulator
VADICEAAGIGRRTFFRYFATKDDVLAEPGLRVWLDDITAGDCADPGQHLQQIFDTEPLTASATSPQEPATQMGTPRSVPSRWEKSR